MTNGLNRNNDINFGTEGNFAKIKGIYRVDKPLENFIGKKPFMNETSKEFPSKYDIKGGKEGEKLSFQEWAEKYNQ